MMKKIIFKTIVLLNLLIFFNLFSTYYPDTSTDYRVEINFSSDWNINGGDAIGFSHAGADPDVYGLYWPAGGLYIKTNEDSPFTVVYASPFGVDKELDLDDSPLALASDLYLADGVALTRSGIIEAKRGSLILTGNLNLESNTLTFINFTTYISGNGNVIDFSKGGKIEMKDYTNLYLDNCYLKGLQEGSIIFPAKERGFYLTNCIVQLDADYCANINLYVLGEVLITGNYNFCINNNLSLENGGSLIFDQGTTFSIGYYGDIQMSLDSNIIFDDCNIELGLNNVDNGVFLEFGNIFFTNNVNINDDGNYKTFKIGSSAEATVLADAKITLDNTVTFSFY